MSAYRRDDSDTSDDVSSLKEGTVIENVAADESIIDDELDKLLEQSARLFDNLRLDTYSEQQRKADDAPKKLCIKDPDPSSTIYFDSSRTRTPYRRQTIVESCDRRPCAILEKKPR